MADSEASSPPASPPPAPAEPQTLGQLLRGARLAQDLTLEQLSTELRIEGKQLNALEEDRFEQIGVPVFVKGYLKQYCLRLGLNFHDMLALYYKQTTLPDVQIQPSRTIKLRDERQITSWIVAAIILLVVVAGLAVWWSNGGSFDSLSAPRSAADTAETSDAAPPPAAPVEPPPAAQPIASVVAAPPPAAPALPPVDGDAAAAPQVATPEALAAAASADSERAAPPVAIPLEFTFDQESWAEVTDARGERLLFGLNAAGRRVTVRGEPPFAIVLGNADSVRLSVDGEPYSIPTTGREGALARFSVDIAEE
jgi:cytoskeleton protein RodZ